ncbi:putative disease resistance RPP13-like protein 1-like [Hibiscus syriacus]|uniref:O-fucosyltransferase family protein n=1 Tax=Hibiscus syriacus TaxID=106335 RepID=A0A6A2ZDQ4_HIBSY|nr:putative disease resistance RPP13-like protein 1-like [Hibiscus syriacus]
MFNHRGSSLMKNVSTTTKFISRKSPRAIALYIFLLFAFSIFIFVFNAGNIEDDQFNPISLRITDEELWDPPSSRGLRPCAHPTSKYKPSLGSDRYLMVSCNGGLNQIRTAISDMVAVAYIMTAVLVIPKLDTQSFSHDSSTFSDIFDEHHFITTLQQDVRIVRELPKELEHVPRAQKHFTSWSNVGYYKEMTQLWNEYQVINVVESDSILANNDLPLDIQRLRCRSMYHALRFPPSIESLGKELVDRLRTQSGKYIAVHLSYEKDMLAFTGCTSGLTDVESEELRILRENTKDWKVKDINPTEQRKGGFCPLTPKEVGIFLRAVGYPPSTLIYVAYGEIYGGDARLSELKSYFPNLVSKEKLATKEELDAVSKHATQTVALDYIVSLESDVFVPSSSDNMARAIEGHRRFFVHRKTISPDRKGLAKLFDELERGKLKISSFSEHVQQMHKNRRGSPRKRKGPAPGMKGEERFKTEEFFYDNPYHECICSPKGV